MTEIGKDGRAANSAGQNRVNPSAPKNSDFFNFLEPSPHAGTSVPDRPRYARKRAAVRPALPSLRRGAVLASVLAEIQDRNVRAYTIRRLLLTRRAALRRARSPPSGHAFPKPITR